jgi:hypothetical protein
MKLRDGGMAGFDPTAPNSVGGDDTTRPRRHYLNKDTFELGLNYNLVFLAVASRCLLYVVKDVKAFLKSRPSSLEIRDFLFFLRKNNLIKELYEWKSLT